MEIFDAYERQALPTGNGEDVATMVQSDLRNPDFQQATKTFRCANMHELYFVLAATAADLRVLLARSRGDTLTVGDAAFDAVAEDIEHRVVMGAQKYGTRLKTNNGRNVVLDAYEELLDLTNYVRQGIAEANGEIEEINYDQND